MAAVKINEGTQTTIQTVLVGGTETQVHRIDMGNGTNASLFAGTITELSNLVKGTMTALAAGTITGGTLQNLNAGTLQLNRVPVVAGTSYGTLGTTGAAVIGTLIAASGAGTKQYISGLSIVVASGTVDCAITNVGTIAGPNGAGVLARGQFTPGGGIMRDFDPVMASGTNGTIGYWMGGAGTAYFTVQYWQGV